MIEAITQGAQRWSMARLPAIVALLAASAALVVHPPCPLPQALMALGLG